jgi:ABC-type uncharacterized transport system permease subunit
MDWKSEFFNQLWVFVLKYVNFFALAAIVVKISIQLKRKKATVLGVITSLIVGLGAAYIFGGLVDSLTTNQGARNVAIAFIAIASEKIAEFLIFDMNVGGWFKKIGEMSIEYLRKIFGLND